MLDTLPVDVFNHIIAKFPYDAYDLLNDREIGNLRTLLRLRTVCKSFNTFIGPVVLNRIALRNDPESCAAVQAIAEGPSGEWVEAVDFIGNDETSRIEPIVEPDEDGEHTAAAPIFVYQELHDTIQKSLTRLPNLTSTALYFSDSVFVWMEDDSDKAWAYRQFFNLYYRIPILLDVLNSAPTITSLTITNFQTGLHDTYALDSFKEGLRRMTEFSLATISLSDPGPASPHHGYYDDTRGFWRELYHWLEAMPDLEWLSLKSDRPVPISQFPTLPQLKTASFEGLVFTPELMEKFFAFHCNSLEDVNLNCQLFIGNAEDPESEVGWATVLGSVKGAVHRSRLEAVRCWYGLHYFSEDVRAGHKLGISPAKAERDEKVLHELRSALLENRKRRIELEGGGGVA